MVRQTIGRPLTADHRIVTSPNFSDAPKSVKKRRTQLHARDVRGLGAFYFCPLEEKIVNKSCFPSILKHCVYTNFKTR